jgi:hypothetical protein
MDGLYSLVPLPSGGLSCSIERRKVKLAAARLLLLNVGLLSILYFILVTPFDLYYLT